MSEDEPLDYYEVLQISPNADPDTIHRVYRLLAQRVHPDNLGTGDATRFRAIHEAYAILSDPEKRATTSPTTSGATTGGVLFRQRPRATTSGWRMPTTTSRSSRPSG